MNEKVLAVVVYGGCFIIFAVFMAYVFIIGPAKDEKEQAKIEMLSALQKYSISTITVDDFDIEEVDKMKTYSIYKVSVKKSNFQIAGDFYVALIKPNGISTESVSVSKDLYKLQKSMYD